MRCEWAYRSVGPIVLRRDGERNRWVMKHCKISSSSGDVSSYFPPCCPAASVFQSMLKHLDASFPGAQGYCLISVGRKNSPISVAQRKNLVNCRHQCGAIVHLRQKAIKTCLYSFFRPSGFG